jgi:hypothetical protein
LIDTGQYKVGVLLPQLKMPFVNVWVCKAATTFLLFLYIFLFFLDVVKFAA